MAAASGTNATSQKAHHFTEDDDFTQENWKYWTQRYDIFHKYDEDIYMTEDLWFGVTPELVAKYFTFKPKPSKTSVIPEH